MGLLKVLGGLKVGRLPSAPSLSSFGSSPASRVSPPSALRSTIAGDVLIVAIILLFIALPALFAGV